MKTYIPLFLCLFLSIIFVSCEEEEVEENLAKVDKTFEETDKEPSEEIEEEAWINPLFGAWEVIILNEPILVEDIQFKEYLSKDLEIDLENLPDCWSEFDWASAPDDIFDFAHTDYPYYQLYNELGELNFYGLLRDNKHNINCISLEYNDTYAQDIENNQISIFYDGDPGSEQVMNYILEEDQLFLY